jgi:hypothetical protein
VNSEQNSPIPQLLNPPVAQSLDWLIHEWILVCKTAIEAEIEAVIETAIEAAKSRETVNSEQ